MGTGEGQLKKLSSIIMWSYLSAYFDIHYTFQVGSYSYDMARMVFEIATLGYIQRNQSIVMDYEIEIR